MSIGRHNRIVCIVLACLVFGVGCCENRQDHGYSPLPDPWWEGREGDRSRVLLPDAREFCKRHNYIEGIPDPLVRGQFEVALHALAREQDIESIPPIALVSTAGLMSNGEDTYVQLWAINPNRETSRVHIFARSPNGEFIRMLIDMQPEAKHDVYRCQVFFQTDYTPWELLTSRASQEADNIIHVAAANCNTIPFPSVSAASVCVAVEDRSGRMSNFVPVNHLDLMRSPATAPTLGDK